MTMSPLTGLYSSAIGFYKNVAPNGALSHKATRAHSLHHTVKPTTPWCDPFQELSDFGSLQRCRA